jgi:vacuolar-type H+-ATPase catalytic subunit A/Vma1
MVPPYFTGTVEYIAPEAPHTIEDEIATIDCDGVKKRITMV